MNLSHSSPSAGRKAMLRATVFAAVLMGAQGASFANALGYRAYQQAWDPSKPTVTSVSVAGTLYGGLSTDLVNSWNKLTANVTTDWTNLLRAPNFAGDGYTLENPVLQIGGVDSVEMRVAPVQDSLAPAAYQSPTTVAPVLVIHSTGTRIDAGSTVPFPSPGGDPTFHVTFDLTAYIKLGIGPRVTAVNVSTAAVVLNNAQYTPDNAVAKEGDMLGTLQNIFGARSFSQRISDAIDGQTVNIKGYLGPAVKTANDELSKQAPAGDIVAGIFADSQYLNIVFAPHVQPDSAGQMAGTLTVVGESHLPAAQRSVPTGDCSKVISLSDTVQVQPDYVAALNPVSFQTGSGPTMSLDSQIRINGGTIASAPDGWSCRYAVGGLADNFLNNLHFNEPSVGSSNGSLPSFGYVIAVNFAGCGAGSSSAGNFVRVSQVACLSTPAICSDQLTPMNGQPLNCNLAGDIVMSGSGGAGVLKQTPFANPNALNPGGPVQSKTVVAPSVWGAQNVNRTLTPGTTTAPQWGTAATSTFSGAAAGSSLRSNVGSSLQARPAQLAAPSAFALQH